VALKGHRQFLVCPLRKKAATVKTIYSIRIRHPPLGSLRQLGERAQVPASREHVYLYGAVSPEDGTCLYLVMPAPDTECFQIFMTEPAITAAMNSRSPPISSCISSPLRTQSNARQIHNLIPLHSQVILI
jgi:hypothetical protein